MTTPLRTAMGLAALSLLAPLGHADDLADLRAELDTLRREVAQLRQASPPSWLDAARDAELRALVEDVLGDADARRAFAQAGPGAGYDGKNFYLEGDGYRLNLSGQIQFRYVLNSDGGRGGPGDDADGFELRRAKVQFKGYVADPKIDYVARLASSRSSASTSLEEAAIGYTFEGGTRVSAGKMKLPFLRQELMSSTRQLAVDRGLGTEYFTLNFAEQVQVATPIGERVVATLAYSDGGNSESSSALSDTVDYAFTGRLDATLLGDAKDGADLRPRADQGETLLVGLAVHAEQGDASGGETLAWTLDALGKAGPMTAAAAYMGGRDNDADIEVHGLTAEAGYALNERWQPFVRYDGLWEVSEGDLQALTAGTNVYLHGHAAKLTADVVWVFAGDAIAGIPGLNSAPTNSGIGLVTGQEHQTALRVQFQLLF